MFTEARFKLAKTEAGREALAQRSGCSPRERQLLILCDGRKTWGDFVELLGQPVLPVLASLQHKGLVLSVTPMLEKLAEFSDTGTWLAAGSGGAVREPSWQSNQVSRAGRTDRTRVEAAGEALSRLQARHTRSLAASKMLLLQSAGDGEALVQAMLPALAFLLSESGASYASRVLTQVMATLPEAQLGAFCDAALTMGLTQQMVEA